MEVVLPRRSATVSMLPGEEKHHQKTKKPEAYGYADYDDEILLQFGGGHVGVVLSGRRLQFGLGRIKTPSRRRWLVGS
jgi:hypothetical protein